jgi:hypothetical protein
MKNYGLTIASMFTASGNTMNQLDRSTFSLPGPSSRQTQEQAPASGASVLCSLSVLSSGTGR